MSAIWIAPASTQADTIVEKLGTQSRPVHVKSTSKLRPYGNCYWNVEAVVDDRGGAIVLGWMLYEIQGFFLCAEHHAVWRMPNGELRDVTAKNQSFETSFIPLPHNDQVSLDRSPTVRTLYVPLKNDPYCTQLLIAYDAFYESQSRLAEYVYSIGYRCEMQRALARGQTTLWTPNVTEAQRECYAGLVADCQTKHAAMEAVQRALR